MKKILVSILFILISFSIFNIAYASTFKVDLNCEDTKIKADGDTRTVKVSADTGDDTFKAMQFEIYTNDNIEIVSIKPLLSDGYSFDANKDNKTIALICSNTSGFKGKIDICEIEVKINNTNNSNFGLMYLDFENEYAKCINIDDNELSVESESIMFDIEKKVQNYVSGDFDESLDDNNYESEEKKEESYDGKLPQTGSRLTLIMVSLMFVVIAVICYIRLKK